MSSIGEISEKLHNFLTNKDEEDTSKNDEDTSKNEGKNMMN